MLVHGFFGRGRDFTALGQALVAGAPSLRPLLPDLVGHGASPPMPDGADLSTLADALLDWLDAVCPGTPAPVVAHSMGGRVVLVAYARAPERFGRLVFIDAPVGDLRTRPSPLNAVMAALLAAPERAGERAAMVEPLRRIAIGPRLRAWIDAQVVARDDGGFGWSFDREAMAAYRRRAMAEDLWPIVQRLAPHGLSMIVGERSPYVMRADRERFAGLGVPVVMLPGAGHDVHLERPQEAVAAVLAGIGG